MRHSTSLAFIAVLPALVTPTTARQAPTTILVSRGPSNNIGNAGSELGGLTDAGEVVFFSEASNFGAPNGIYARNSALTATTLLSTSGSGGTMAVSFFEHDVTRDGRYLALTSTSTHVVPGDVNAVADVFRLDRSSGVWQLVSVSTSGAQGNAASSAELGGSLSADGNLVAFLSAASNFAPGDATGTEDVFVRDMLSGVTECISVSASGLPAGGCNKVDLSADGRWIVFSSTANNIVAGDANNELNVFVRDRASGVTRLVDVTLAGAAASQTWSASAISGDGRFVIFNSASSQLVAGDTNGQTEPFCADLLSGAIERIAISSGGVEANNYSVSDTGWLVSYDGRFVAFTSQASTLVAGDTNNRLDAFVRDRWLGTTERVSLNPSGGQLSTTSYADSISEDGRSVVFTSSGTGVTPDDTQNGADVFLRRRGPALPQTFCTSGTSANGCVAVLSANVNPSASGPSGCALTVTNVDGARAGLVFYGIDNAGFTPVPWQNGPSLRCVRNPVQRTGAGQTGGTAGACDGSLTLDWDAYQQSHPAALGAPWLPGASACAQAWFRDPPSPGGTLLTNAVVLLVAP